MTDTGALSPGTIVDLSGVGSITWGDPNNAKVSDSSYATATTAKGQYTHYLKATNFNFSVPTGATINGIQVELQAKVAAGPRDIYAYIVKADTIKTTYVPTYSTTTTEAYISNATPTTNLWSQTWEPADINDSTFGVCFNHGPYTASSINHIRITVYYTGGEGPPAFVLHSLSMTGCGI